MDICASLVLVYFILTHEPGEGTRPLLFPFWCFETDFSKSPTYEIAFMFSNLTVFINGFNYSFMLGTQIVWMRQICCKAEIVIWQIEDLMDGIRPTNDGREREAFDSLIRQRMREIVKHHNSMDM
ncbi:jg3827 [Pararge aegeria aegeria]|uniref:Jg3827 protein n=1 Tax=Pararge aegeria aegeria TaxID=348720 RepID=A0A8S4RHW8_9NEOP|nr:jg3827 [Pararge aegeria aegeria]